LGTLIAMIVYDVDRFGYQETMIKVLKKPEFYAEIFAEIFLGNVLISDIM